MHAARRGALLAVAVEQIVQALLRVESKEFVQEFRRLESAGGEADVFACLAQAALCGACSLEDKALHVVPSRQWFCILFLWLVNVLV